MTEREEKDPKRRVNPARRHDAPEPHPAGEEARPERAAPEVDPVQREPLDPLDPCGIGG